jgi:ferredoxin-NADP reductase
LLEVKRLTDTPKHFTWEVTGPRPFTFTAGQFISLHLEHDGSDDMRRRLKAREATTNRSATRKTIEEKRCRSRPKWRSSSR